MPFKKNKAKFDAHGKQVAQMGKVMFFPRIMCQKSSDEICIIE